jgi:EmrB/QacA subfamily drug resistance transporter
LPRSRRPSPATSGRRGLAYKWVALGVTSLGVLMSAIDSTIVVLGLPVMVHDLRASLVTMVWVIMGYTLVSTASLLVLGRIADMFGRVRMYNLGFVVFTVASVLCGTSHSGGQLIAFRLLQGLGSALLMVNSIAIITEAFPREERGRALGLNSVVWNAGSILGPLIGGLLLSGFSWRYLFFVNLPIGAAGTVAAFLFLQELSTRGASEGFDLGGAALFTCGITAILLVLTQGLSLGFTSPPMLALTAVGLLCLLAFYWLEHRLPFPVLDFRLFENRLYGLSVAAAMLQALALFAVSFLVAYYLEAVKGEPPLTTAFLTLPTALVSSVVGPFSGRWSDRIGTRLPATVGLLIQSAGVLWLSFLRPESGVVSVLAPLAILGLGGGLFWSPNTSAAMGAAPVARLGVASATLSTLRNVGFLMSYALAIAVAAKSLPPQVMNALFLHAGVQLGAPDMAAFTTGMSHALHLSFGLSLVAALVSSLRPQPARARLEPAAH